MKKLLLLITALFILASVEGQILRYSNYTAPAPPEEPSGGITDDFEAYSAGNIGGQGNWVAVAYNFTVIDDSGNNIIRPTQTSSANKIYLDIAVSNDQFAEAEFAAVNSNVVGVVARSSTDMSVYYRLVADDSERTLVCVSGSVYIIGTVASGVSVGDVIKLEVNGTTLTVYLNGEVDTAMTAGVGAQGGNNGIFTDNRISSGYVGLYGYGTNGTSLDNYRYGEL